jgi:hypothetical protein
MSRSFYEENKKMINEQKYFINDCNFIRTILFVMLKRTFFLKYKQNETLRLSKIISQRNLSKRLTDSRRNER